MTQLSIFGKPIVSIFQLLGDNENDISYSIGWTLFKSPSFLKVFIAHVTGKNFDLAETAIRLQSYHSSHGFTDFEIELPGIFYLIIESKRHWNYPTTEQLEKYTSRSDFAASPAPIKKLIVLNDTSKEYTSVFFKNWQINNYDISVLSFRQIFKFAQVAASTGTVVERRLLTELGLYLKPLITMQDKMSNMVWVVSLSEGHAVFSSLSFRQIVEQKNIYFHPIGGSYRKEPPNYIGFRYQGKLQSIHHVESYSVFRNPNKIDAEFISIELETPYFVYSLGPKIGPSHTIANGSKIRMANQTECMLDTLLTSQTITEAREITKKRLQDRIE